MPQIPSIPAETREAIRKFNQARATREAVRSFNHQSREIREAIGAFNYRREALSAFYFYGHMAREACHRMRLLMEGPETPAQQPQHRQRRRWGRPQRSGLDGFKVIDGFNDHLPVS